jgi:hypothetical protein
MNASRAAVIVVGVNLVAVWVAAAAGGRAVQPPSPPDVRAMQERAVVEAQTVLVAATDRLRRHTGPSAEDAVVHRDPFAFGGTGPVRPSPAADVPAPVEPAEAPGAPADPEIVLQGMAESGEGESVVRTAILNVGGELVFATAGSTLGGRFTVVAVGDTSIEIEAIDGGTRRTIRWQ